MATIRICNICDTRIDHLCDDVILCRICVFKIEFLLTIKYGKNYLSTLNGTNIGIYTKFLMQELELDKSIRKEFMHFNNLIFNSPSKRRLWLKNENY